MSNTNIAHFHQQKHFQNTSEGELVFRLLPCNRVLPAGVPSKQCFYNKSCCCSVSTIVIRIFHHCLRCIPAKEHRTVNDCGSFAESRICLVATIFYAKSCCNAASPRIRFCKELILLSHVAEGNFAHSAISEGSISSAGYKSGYFFVTFNRLGVFTEKNLKNFLLFVIWACQIGPLYQ